MAAFDVAANTIWNCARLRRYAPIGLMLLLVAELSLFSSMFREAIFHVRARDDFLSVVGDFCYFHKYNEALFGLSIILLAKFSDYKALILGQRHNRFLYLTTHLGSVSLLYFMVLKITTVGTGLPSGALIWLSSLFFLALFGSMATAALMLASLQFWARFVREQKRSILALLSFIGAYSLISKRFLDDYFAEITFQPTARAATLLDALFGFEINTDAAARTIAVGSFSVELAPSCLGYQGIGLIILFLGAYIHFTRKRLIFPNVLLIIPLAIAAMFLLNPVRIALLMAVGASLSPEVALLGFHSAAGWWNLMIVAILSIVSINRLKCFALRPATKALQLSEQNILLVPQLLLLAVALGTLLFTASFDWLYPVRVLVVGAILFHLRAPLNLAMFRVNSVAMAIGAVVFIMWILFVPASAEKAHAFGTALFSVPLVGAVSWLVFRIIGAVVIVPIAEEMAFRGFLLPYFEEVLSGLSSPTRQIGAALLSSAAFGALHGSWVAGTLAGIGFAAARYYRGRLFDAVCAHMTANLLLAVYVLAGTHWSYW